MQYYWRDHYCCRILYGNVGKSQREIHGDGPRYWITITDGERPAFAKIMGPSPRYVNIVTSFVEIILFLYVRTLIMF